MDISFSRIQHFHVEFTCEKCGKVQGTDYGNVVQNEVLKLQCSDCSEYYRNYKINIELKKE